MSSVTDERASVSSSPELVTPRRVVIGVDTHTYVHVAVALDAHGGRIADLTVSADGSGYDRLRRWAEQIGRPIAFGVEGTGSYGARVAAHLRRHGYQVVEVNRPDRGERRAQGKSDLLDAENAARAVLAGKATATPKSGDGQVEMLRQIKAAKARTAAMVTLKALLVTAPAKLREELQPLSKMALLHCCAALRPGPMATPLAAAKHCLRELARRWLALDAEVKTHQAHLEALTRDLCPAMTDALGIGPDTATELLIIAGDNRDRVRSEAAWARLCGVAPVPASSGRTQRMRLSRGGHRQANAALYRSVIVRLRFHQPTIDYVTRRTAEGKTKAKIIRCLKRYLARETWAYLHPERHTNQDPRAA